MPDTTDPLERAFAAVLQNRDRDLSLLKAAVYSYVDAMKAVGWPAERIIIAIKDSAARAGVVKGGRLQTDTTLGVDAPTPLQRAVAWCIEHYYREHLAS